MDWLSTGHGSMMLADAQPGATPVMPPQTPPPPKASVHSFSTAAIARTLANDKGPWVGKGMGELSHEELYQKAAIAVGNYLMELGVPRNPEVEANITALLVRAFEIKGYSGKTADEFLKLLLS